MNNVDDTLLMSYVDGELDVATSREVEAVLRMQPDLAHRVRGMRADSALLRAAFNHALHDAPPSVAVLPSVQRAVQNRNWHMPLAVAASALLLACGVLLGHSLGSANSLSVAVTERSERDAALQAVLEAHRSGSTLQWSTQQTDAQGDITAVSTYRNNDGRFCREFEETRSVGATAVREAGVACRDDNGQWRVRIRYYP